MSSSSLNTSALMKAAGIGAGVLLLLTLVTQAMSFASIYMTYANPTGDLSTVSPLSLVVTCCGCIVYLLYGGVGALYAHFAAQDGQSDVGMAALGGALAAAIDGLVIGIVGAILGIVSSAVVMPMMMPDLDPESAALMAGVGLMGGIIGSIIGICMSLGIGAVLGAIGGAIYAAVAGNRNSGSATPGMGV
jgi:hypothetical protein